MPVVAQVQVYGEQLYAVRVALDPDRVAAMGLGFDQVQQAVVAANSNAPVGILQGSRQQLSIRANDQPQDAAAFSELVVGGRSGAPVRLGDIARVEDGVQNQRVAPGATGAVPWCTRAAPAGCQTVDVVDGVRAALPALRERCRRGRISASGWTAPPPSAPRCTTCRKAC